MLCDCHPLVWMSLSELYHTSFCWLTKGNLTVWPADNIISVLSAKCQHFLDSPFSFSRPSSQSGAKLCFASGRETSAASDKAIVHRKKVKVGRGRKTTFNAGIVRRVKLRFNAELWSCGVKTSIEASPAYRRCWTQPGCVAAVTPRTDLLFLINVDFRKSFVIASPAWNLFASFQRRLKPLQCFIHQLFGLFYRWWCHLWSSF